MFTKDDLIVGEHWVEFENGEIGLYNGRGFVLRDRSFHINAFYDNLTIRPFCPIDYYEYAVSKVLIPEGTYIGSFDGKFEVIWERKSPAQLKLEELEVKQREIADDIAKIRSELSGKETRNSDYAHFKWLYES